MRRVKSTLLLAIGLVSLVSALALMCPKAVHAVTAVLVQDVDNPGRNPFMQGCFGNLECAIPTPPGRRVVVQHLSARIDATSGCRYLELRVSISKETVRIPCVDTGPITGGREYVAEGPVTFYAEPGASMTGLALAFDSKESSLFEVTVTGYTIAP